MKIIKGIIGATFLFLAVTAIAFASVPPSDTAGLQSVPSDQVPPFGTFWILGTNGITAPLPCPPADMPDAPIYALPNGQFLVDARASESLAQSATPDSVFSGAMSPMGMDGPNGSSGNTYGPDVFHVQSLTVSNGFLVFYVQGLITNDEYLLVRKTVLNNDFTNYWVPQTNFVASDSNQVVVIPLPQDSPTGFYRVLDWTSYQGPQPTIISPANNSTNGGTSVTVQGGLGDIYPPQSAQLQIDGVVVQTITNGPFSFSFDSTLVGNSAHTIRIIVTSKIWYDPSTGFASPFPIDPTYAFPFDSSTAVNTLTTSNFLAISSAPYAATADYGQAVFGIDTSEAAIIDLAISDGPTNAAFKHISVTNGTAGTISIPWDLTDDGNSPVAVPGRYLATITAQAFMPGGLQPDASDPNEKVIWVTLVKFAHLGQLAVFRTRISNTFGLNDNQQSITQAAADSEWNASLVTPNDPADGYTRGPNPRNVVAFQSNNDYLQLWAYATNASEGEIEYVGHSRPDDGGFGSDDDAVGSTHIVDPDEVSANLGNTYDANSGSYSFGITKAFVRIEGCSSGFKTSHMNWYFGVPDSPILGLSPSVWLGWNVSYDYHGAWGLNNSPFENHINNFQGWWNSAGFGGVTITTAIANDFGSMGRPNYIQYRVVHGTSSMHWAY